MGGGNLSDQQLKEFDAYLNGASDGGDGDNDMATPSAPTPMKQPVSDNGIDDIPRLHKKKVELIMDLLDKIDAQTHKDIVADLVDEMQYQKSVIKREEEKSANLKKLISLANEASR